MITTQEQLEQIKEINDQIFGLYLKNAHLDTLNQDWHTLAHKLNIQRELINKLIWLKK